jgi:hypothetical protein
VTKKRAVSHPEPPALARPLDLAATQGTRTGVLDRFPDAVPFLCVVAVTLLAKGAALLPGYSIDDWATSANGTTGLVWDVLWKGRGGHWLFLTVVRALGAEPNPARILYGAFGILAYAAFGFAAIRFWGLTRSGWLAVCAAAMVANHPYTSEIFTFRIGLPLAALVMAILAVLLQPRRPTISAFAARAGLFALAMALYPIALHFGGMVLLLAFAVSAFATIAPAAHEGSDLEPSGEIGSRAMDFAKVMAAGLVLYAVVTAAIARLLAIDSTYFTPIALVDVPGRLLQAAKSVAQGLAFKNVLVPPPVQVAFFALIGLLAFRLLNPFRAARRTDRPARFKAALLLPLLLGVAALWSLGVFLFTAGFRSVPRNMAHVGLLWAALLIMATAGLRHRVARGTVGALAALVLFSFVAVSQHVFEDQRRLNVRDVNVANRIVARLEMQPAVTGVRRVAVVGGFAWYPAEMAPTQWGDMNISGFGAVWSQVPLLEEATGYNWIWATDPTEKAAAKAYCATVAPWPGADALTVRGELAIVCLSKP